MRWPIKNKTLNQIRAKTYQPCSGREPYRVTPYPAGKRRMESRPTNAADGRGGLRHEQFVTHFLPLRAQLPNWFSTS